MKLVKNILTILNRLILRNFRNLNLSQTILNIVWIKLTKNNKVKIIKSKLIKSNIQITGNHNRIIGQKLLILKSTIKIEGNGNKIILNENIKLRYSSIIIRGNNCTIKVDKNTTFGGIKIINVGIKNEIKIGSDCLFSDQIEIWASDTHSIFDKDNNWINQEKPIEIANNVWIGSRVVILKGVKIGNNSIIGIGSIVTKNIPDNVIAAGNPARIIKNEVYWKLKYKSLTKTDFDENH